MIQDTTNIVNGPLLIHNTPLNQLPDTLMVKVVDGSYLIPIENDMLIGWTVIDIVIVFTAIIAVLIAFNQFRISKHQIKVGLFERRFEFYTKLRNLLRELIGGLDDININEVYTISHELRRISIFLFDKEITDMVNSYHLRIINMRRLYNRMHGPHATPVGQQRNEEVDALYSEIEIVEADIVRLEKTFSKYMKMTFGDPWYIAIIKRTFRA